MHALMASIAKAALGALLKGITAAAVAGMIAHGGHLRAGEQLRFQGQCIVKVHHGHAHVKCETEGQIRG